MTDSRSTAEIKREIRKLMRLNRVHGAHHLRTIRYLQLMRVIAEREAA